MAKDRLAEAGLLLVRELKYFGTVTSGSPKQMKEALELIVEEAVERTTKRINDGLKQGKFGGQL
jgi:hypothetical protein